MVAAREKQCHRRDAEDADKSNALLADRKTRSLTALGMTARLLF